MPFIIEDGQGTGQSAGVTNEGRLRASARIFTLLEDESINGSAYNFSTGTVTLTTAGESGIFIIQSADPVNFLVIEEVALSFGKSTGGTGNDITFREYYNPTGGTLLTTKTAITAAVNRNLGVSVPIVANVYQGTEGSTITGGSVGFLRFYVDQTREIGITNGPVLANGSTWALSVQPGTSNTSLKVAINVKVAVVLPTSL